MGTRATGAVLAAALAISTLAAPATAMASATYHVELTGGPDGIACDTGNLFGHMPFLEPGGSDSGNVEISNLSGKTQRLWLMCDGWKRYDDGEAAKLLDGVKVSLSYDGRTVWEGAIGSEEFDDPHQLGVMAPDTSATVRYVLEVDPSLRVSDAAAENAVRWVFTAEEAPDGTTLDPQPDDPIVPAEAPSQGTDANVPSTPRAADGGTLLAKTGDGSLVAAAVAGTVAAGSLAALAVLRNRKGGAPWDAR